jgi:hypothetical protein
VKRLADFVNASLAMWKRLQMQVHLTRSAMLATKCSKIPCRWRRIRLIAADRNAPDGLPIYKQRRFPRPAFLETQQAIFVQLIIRLIDIFAEPF